MKKDVLNKIPALKNNDGNLSGGFSALSIEQSKKIKGGGDNTHCFNSADCTRNQNKFSCNNSRNCDPKDDTTLESI